MAEQGEPLYDFPEPSQTSKFMGHQRSRSSLRSISVLDRLLLTVPVWLQLSINPATALHILQREPPGTFLVRHSRTSQKKVLCVRLADDSEPSFVQQFGIQEEHSTLCLETSGFSFPDLPRMISFYCVSRDVLPFPLELPEAIARATSHKELESISHMGIEFWNSHLNIRGPREAPKPPKDAAKKPDSAPSVPAPAFPQMAPDTRINSDNQTPSDAESTTESESQPVKEESSSSAALFNEFCPIKTRSPGELNYGSGIGGLCFINPLFLQSLNAWSRRRMFKRSIKVRISTETSTLLSPPLAPPPPPPLMPKTKSRCKAGKQVQRAAQSHEAITLSQDTTPAVQDINNKDYVEPSSTSLPRAQEVIEEEEAQLPTVKETPAEESDYMQPSPVVNPSLSPYFFPKTAPKKPLTLSPYDSPSTSPSISPYPSPSPSPKIPFPLSPFTSTSCLAQMAQMAEDAYHIPAAILKSDKQLSGAEDVAGEKAEEQDENELVQRINTASLNDRGSSSLSCEEETEETHST